MRSCVGKVRSSAPESKDSPSSLPHSIPLVLPSRSQLLSPWTQSQIKKTMRSTNGRRSIAAAASSRRNPSTGLTGGLDRERTTVLPQVFEFLVRDLGLQGVLQKLLAKSCLPTCSAATQIRSAPGLLVRLIYLHSAAGQAHNSDQFSRSPDLPARDAGAQRYVFAARPTTLRCHLRPWGLPLQESRSLDSSSSQSLLPTIRGCARAS